MLLFSLFTYAIISLIPFYNELCTFLIISEKGEQKITTFPDRFELEPPDVDELPLAALLRFWPLLDCCQTKRKLWKNGKGKQILLRQKTWNLYKWNLLFFFKYHSSGCMRCNQKVYQLCNYILLHLHSNSFKQFHFQLWWYPNQFCKLTLTCPFCYQMRTESILYPYKKQVNFPIFRWIWDRQTKQTIKLYNLHNY